MLDNSHISFITQTSGGFDANGNPVEPTQTIGEKIPCNKKTAKNNLTVIQEGQIRDVAYIITIDEKHLNDITKSIQLYKNDVEFLQLQVISYEHLKYVNRIKIFV